MGRIKRPTKVQKGQKNYLTNERYQDYAENQFKTIYDFLDAYAGDVLFDNPDNTAETINISTSLSTYDSLEIWYRIDREVDDDVYVIRGCEKLQKPVNSHFNIQCLFRVSTTRVVGAVSLYKVNEKSISLVAGAGWEFTTTRAPINNTINSAFITRIIGRKEK